MTGPGLIDRLRKRLSRLSLFHRIALGNAFIIVAGAVLGTLITRHLASQAADWWLIMVFAAAGTLFSLGLNFVILRAALHPLRELGLLARRLHAGEKEIDPAGLKYSDPYTTHLAATLQTLLEQLEARNRELRALSERTIRAQEDERRAIAQSLHDDTGQALSMLLIQLDRLEGKLPAAGQEVREQLAEVRNLAASTLTELRRILSGLRPAILDDLGLIPASRWYARTTLEEAGIRIAIKTPGSPLDIQPVVATTLFRITQEAVNNIIRHAGARIVKIVLQSSMDGIHLHVEDDGRGFDLQQAAQRAVQTQQLGLLGIRERAELLGGRADLDSQPGKGTRLDVFIPMNARGARAHE